MEPDSLSELDGTLLDGLVFCAKVYAAFERFRSAPGGRDKLRLRATPAHKRLLEELFPICRYVQTYYRPGRYISVRWVNGSQSFDAELHQTGDYIEQGYYPALAHLEATSAMHENEHWIWKLLSQGEPAYAPSGISKVKGKPVQSEPVVFSNTEHVHAFVPIVLAQISKKAAIAYPVNTSLVVQCSLNSLYTPDDWTLLVAEVRRDLPTHTFREILIFNVMTEMATSIH